MLFAGLLLVQAAAAKSVLFVAGAPSHGFGEHEHHEACRLLADALEGAGMGVEVSIRHDAWPDACALGAVDAVVVYCDGNQDHVALGHEAELLALAERGVGLVFLHYALDGVPGALDDALLQAVGGRYEEGLSQNPLWTMADPSIGRHPAANGVRPFSIQDEWYYDLRLAPGVVPVLSATPPGEQDPKILAWAYGRSAFGFTGGHFLANWSQPDFRKLVLNAIAWSAGLEVPAQGIESDDPVTVRNPTLLHAIAKGDAADVRNHLRLGADANGRNPQGWTPLHFAAVRGQAECAAVLLAAGAEPDALTANRLTPLHFAAGRGHLEVAELLAGRGADIALQADDGWTALHHAAAKDRVEMAAYLVAQGAEIDALSVRGGTPLHEAAASASPAMIRLLLESGADRGIKAANGKTPLDYAIELDNAPAAALLR